MESLYHQTNQLVQECGDLFARIDKDPNNYEGIENEIQSKINAINANCERLDIFVFKTPINQRPMAKMRVDQLKYDVKHIQASLSNAQAKRLRREQEKAEREHLLSRKFGMGADHTSITVDYLAQEQSSLQNSHRNVDEMLHTGNSECQNLNDPGIQWFTRVTAKFNKPDCLKPPASNQRMLQYFTLRTYYHLPGSNILDTLKYNRETLKGAHRRMMDLANTLGLSNATISLIERRVAQDKYVLFGGMFVTVAVIVIVVVYFS